MRGAFDASLAVLAGMSSCTRRPTASNVGVPLGAASRYYERS